MTVKENHTILSRATIRAIVITALVAVAAVFSTQNTGVAFGSCPYTPNSGDQADLWLDMGSEDTYFTDAEWPGLEVKTFSLKGPFRGDINIRTYNDWGLTTSTTSSEISCTTAQSYTAIKNTESMPIYLKRCNWGDYTSLQFGITHERKCILNGTQSYIYPMLITESDMEGTPLTYTTGGEDGRGTQNTGTTTETTYTPPAQPQTPQQPIDTTQTSQQPDDTCVVQPGQAEEQNGPNPPGTSMPTGDTVIRGRWTGPDVSSVQQISDAMKIHREAIQLILKVRDGKATPAEAQETADTLWLMSHEARKLPIWYENHQNGKNKRLWQLLRQWVTEEGLEPSEEARTAGVPWSVFYNRYGETFTPKQARERYGGVPDGNIGLWRNRNPVAWYQNDPGGLDEVMVGPPKEHGEGKSGDRYSEQDGTWITQAEAFSKYGIRPAGTTMEEWEQNHNLTRLPKWKHPDESGERECTTDPGGESTPPTGNVPEEKPQNFCKAGTIEPILTTALSGQLNIDRTQYPGIDDHKPWDRGRVSAWRSGMGVHWKKDPSGYRNGTDAGTRDTSIPLEHPDVQEAVDWSLDQWEAWNENRQAAGLPRMHIYERKCDRTTLTEFQVYEMYGTPWQPRNMSDFMYQADDWEDQGFWLIKLHREDMIEAAIAMRAVEEQGLELTIDNIAVQWADHPGGREPNFQYEGDRERAIEDAKRKLLVASSPDTYNSDINPEQTSAAIAGPWLHLGLDFRLVTHLKTRIHMTQVAHWVEGAGQAITINNLTNWFVQYHYREADMNVEADRIRTHYNVWNQYKNIWPSNTETNPWHEPMIALLAEEATAGIP